MNTSKTRRAITLGLGGSALSLAVIFHGATAHAATCNVNFNDYNALNVPQTQESLTFLLAPWYNQQCAGYTFTVAETPSAVTQGHYHLSYENTCVNCFTATDYGLNRDCAHLSPMLYPACITIDNAAYGRFASSMNPGQTITLTVSPYPSQYCILGGDGVNRCVNVMGKPFSPRSIIVRSGGPVNILATKVWSIGVAPGIGVPVTASMAINNLAPSTVYNIAGFGQVDHLTVTGAAAQNFSFDNVVVDVF